MSFIKDPMSFTTTRMKSIIPNRLPFRHSLKGIDASESAIPDHDVPPSNSVNVVLFGETGVGKSSVINLIAQRTLAKVSSDVNGCTMESTKHDIEFDGMNFAIFDTIGLEEPQMGVNGYLKAIEKAYELITKLSHAGGVHLLLFCMRGGRITATTQSNYRLFCELLCGSEVPIALVFTGLEREVEMEDWWRRNHKHIEGYGIKSQGHACVTAVLDNDTPGEDLKYNKSQVVIRDLLKTCALKNTAYSPDTASWFVKVGRGLINFIEKRGSPKRKKVLKVLEKRCKLDPETAKKIADMMEKGDPSAQSGAVEQVNPRGPGPLTTGLEEGGRSGDGDAVLPILNSGDETSDDEGKDSQPLAREAVPLLCSDTTFPGKIAETGQQVQDANKEEESRSNVELNAFGRQKLEDGNIYAATPRAGDANKAGTNVHARARPLDNLLNLDGVDRAIDSPGSSRQLGGKSIPDSTTRTISSCSVKEGIKPSREDLDPNSISIFPSSTAKESIETTKEHTTSEVAGRVIPSLMESIRTTKEEPIPEGTSRAAPFPSVRGDTGPKEALTPDGAGRATLSPSVMESDGAGRATPSPNAEGIEPFRKRLHADTIASRGVREGTGPSRENPDPNVTSVSSFSAAKESSKTTKEHSRAGRVTSSPDVRESIMPTKEEPIRASDGTGRATPDAKGGTKPFSKQHHAGAVPSAMPYTTFGETQAIVQSKKAPSPDKWSTSSTGGSLGQKKKAPSTDSGASNWPLTSPRDVSGQSQGGYNLAVVSEPGSRVYTGGSVEQPRNAGSFVQQSPNAAIPTQTRTGRGGSTGQSSSHR